MAISVLLGVISRYKSGYPKNDLSLLSPKTPLMEAFMVSDFLGLGL